MRDALLRFLRVPPTPQPPPGSPPRVFRAAPAFFTLRVLRWGLTQLAAVAGLVWAIQFIRFADTTKAPDFVITILKAVEIFGWLAFITEFFFGWMVLKLDYELRWYMLSDRAIRIREGITTIREKTIALANIQNISVKQGPLQRYLGIADVEVKTAGGGGESGDPKKKQVGEPMHVAYFRGVDNAAAIRDLLREGVRLKRNAGLGDPDEPPHPLDVTTAAQELLAEARALRHFTR
ncbi:MAG TPA: PH domain-containing protein [Thermoanaerobaculia bacterium]|nr:PH domain-containing protein [Thermoanaerobaculia bacterium]